VRSTTFGIPLPLLNAASHKFREARAIDSTHAKQPYEKIFV
jgi:hypothetical protein